jgi:acetylornithine deacetylase
MQIPDIDTEKCLTLLSKLVQIKSYSETLGEIEITDYMAQRMKDIGIGADAYPFDSGKRQNAIGKWKGKDSSNTKSLLFNSHLDTNPVTEG